MRAHGSHSLFELFDIAEDMLAGREWFFAAFSCADAYFYWCFRRGSQLGPDVSHFKSCWAHMLRMESRPSVQKLLAYEKSVQADFAKAA